jgi:hypothetical protein
MSKQPNVMRGRRKDNGYLQTYSSYNFVDKDPVIYEFEYAQKRLGLNDSQVSKGSGVSTTTLRNWKWGKTRKPQNASIEAAYRAMGLRRVAVDSDMVPKIEKMIGHSVTKQAAPHAPKPAKKKPVAKAKRKAA